MTADGTISWTSDEVGALIADVDGNLYGCAPDGTGSTISVGEVVALRPTGEVLWRFPFERLSHGCSAMAITADGQLIVSLGEDGMVLALSE
jgi:outer membrane protein assembly factor BamB